MRTEHTETVQNAITECEKQAAWHERRAAFQSTIGNVERAEFLLSLANKWRERAQAFA